MIRKYFEKQLRKGQVMFGAFEMFQEQVERDIRFHYSSMVCWNFVAEFWKVRFQLMLTYGELDS